MNADDRLDQLEPLVAETLAVLDRHTAQLKQLGAKMVVLTEVVTQQSDNISFLLREQSVIKTDVSELKTDVSELKTDVSEIKTRLNTMDTKFELIIQLLQKPRE